jgi:opacity protein-like surface antigen
MLARISSMSRAALLMTPATIAASVLLTQPALALDPGFFAGVLGGATHVNESTLTAAGVGTVDLTFDLGYDIAGFIGYKSTMGWRVELEGAWRTAEMDEGTFAGVTYNVAGDIQSLSLMANAAYDVAGLGRWQPYFGAGIGIAMLDAEVTGIAGFPVTGANADDTVFAYQGFVGVAYLVSQGVDIFSQYRYFATTDPNFSGIKAEVGTHNFEVGLRINF